MSEQTHQQKLNALLTRRDTARDNVNLVKGRLEAAKTELANVEAECAAKKVTPAKLGDAISKLDTRLDDAVASLGTEITDAETKVQPFLSEDS